jgi:hypothetical protein
MYVTSDYKRMIRVATNKGVQSQTFKISNIA